MKKIILFNAPPNSGKDEAVNHLLKIYDEALHFRFKDQLYFTAAEIANVDFYWMIDIASDRNTKDLPSKDLPDNMTPRQWLIHVSENLIKPNYGKDYFGKKLADSVNNSRANDLVFVSDCGFREEVKALIDNTQHDVHVIQVYRDGCSFAGDSRNYVSIYGKTHFVYNNRTLEDYFKKVENVVHNIIGE